MRGEWQTLEYSNLDKFTEEFSAKFGKVQDSNQAYEEFWTVGETEMPTFTEKISYENVTQRKPKLVYHEFIDTGKVCKTEKEAASILIKKITRLAESKIPSGHNYKHYSLFWRFRPKIECRKDYETLEDWYMGFARFSIVSEG